MSGRPRYPGYKMARARLRFHKLRKADPDMTEPATRAAFGRMLVYGGDGYPAHVPQKGSTTIEAVAWHREALTQPGYWNRTQRSIK